MDVLRRLSGARAKDQIARLTAALSLALFAGCAAPPPPLATTSGRPEVTIAGASKKQVIDAIVAGALEKGSQVRSVNDYGVVLARRDDSNLGAAILFGSRYDAVPESRMHLNVVEVPGGIRVFGRAEMVTNPGSAFERVTDITRGAGQQIQDALVRLQGRFKVSPP
jgi:hypothetical protein